MCQSIKSNLNKNIWISILASSLLCKCDAFCPDNHLNNYTCSTTLGYCFAKLHYDEKNKTLAQTHGCTADTHDGGIFQCRHKKHEKPTEMMCCRDSNYCNSHLKPTMKPSTKSKLPKSKCYFSTLLLGGAWVPPRPLVPAITPILWCLLRLPCYELGICPSFEG